MISKAMAKNLDAILSASKPGDVITLERGLYTTLGCSTNPDPDGQPLKPGVKLIGSGPDTVIISIRPMDDSQLDSSVILGSGDNLVKDLTVDCNVNGTPNRKRNGVYCRGKNNTISGVHVQRPYGVWAPAYRESFALCVQLDDEGSSIINSRVSNPLGTYQTLIQGNVVQGCSAEFNYESRAATGFRMAYNVGHAKNSVIRNCTASYATAGIYCDMKADGITIEDCDFIGCKHGVYLNAMQPTDPNDTEERIYSNLVFRRNNVYLDPTRADSAGILFEHIKAGGGMPEKNAICNADISENNFELLPGSAPVGSVFAVNVGTYIPRSQCTDKLGISKIRFTNNQVDPRMKFRNFSGNADIEGTVVQRITFEA